MEPFTLAAVSLIIAISLMLRKTNDPIEKSFATLCLGIFVYKISTFLKGIFNQEYIHVIEYGGLICIPPLLIRFLRRFLGDQTLFSKDDVSATLLFGLAFGLLYFIPSPFALYLKPLLLIYVSYVFLLSYLSLLHAVKSKTANMEKRRLGYLAIAVTLASILSASDIFHYLGYSLPPLSNLVLAALLYFTLLIIAYPHLTELHELMAKALLVSIVTVFAVMLFYIVMNLFGEGVKLPFTNVLVACFTIVISISPFKILLEKIFRFVYPQSKDVFISLYALDAKLERERALLLEEMAPVFAHEIRNPLGAIKGAAQYLTSESGFGDENGKLLSVIIEEVDRLNSVVTQFLEYAKPHNLNIKEVDVNSLIEKAISLIRTSSGTENITVLSELQPGLAAFPMDEAQIIQVMLNIAINAIDAMPNGGTLTIRTSAISDNSNDTIEIRVQDTGKGISSSELSNIFKPFFTTKERGVGLGLAICKRIIRNHRGDITVKSIPGEGTVITIILQRPSLSDLQ